MRKSAEERFWVKVKKTDGCWLWTAGLFCDGYGQFTLSHRKMVKAHRYSWEIHNGQIPKGKFVCHHCDVKNCVNPTHLFLGTPADNMRDKVEKGRQSRGEKQPHSKLTRVMVLEARERRSKGETLVSLARDMKISYSVMWRTIAGQDWKHIREGEGI